MKRLLLILEFTLVLALPVLAGTVLTGQIGATGPASGDLTGNYPAPVVGNYMISNTKMAYEAANSVKANPAVAAAAPLDLALPSCSSASSALQYTAGIIGTPGAFSCVSTITNPMFPPTAMFTATNAISLTGSGQGGCIVLTAVVNNVTVVPTPGYSACLPAAVAGEVVVVNNQSSHYLSAFPNGTDSINGGAASASVNVPSGALALFTAAAANKWQVTTYLTGTSGDILTFDSTLGSTGYAHDGGLLSGDCTSVALVTTCTKTNGTAFGTAATQNTGASGANLGLLNAGLTFSGADTFSSSLALTGITALGSSGAATRVCVLTSTGVLYKCGPNTAKGSASAPTGTTSTAQVMAGLGSTITFTPASSGQIQVVLTPQSCWNTTNADGAQYQISYGTGTAPLNGVAVTGTQTGPTIKLVNPTTAGSMKFPCNLTANIISLTAGTTYWFDIAFNIVTGGTANMDAVYYTINEQ